MPGIQVGDGTIIASNATVTGNVETYAIVGGNPAKLIRKRYSAEEIERLLQLKWWNWPMEKITENVDKPAN
jgi:virginiamycin A acetyltransferase